MRKTAPLIVGVATAVAVAGIGLAFSDRGPEQAIEAPGAGSVRPAAPAGLPQPATRAPWEAPPLPSAEELAELAEQDYEAYIDALSTQIDPRGPEDPGERPATALTLQDWPEVRLGGQGWDSSRYPQSPPLAAPAGFTLYSAVDTGPHPGDQGRRWEYWRRGGGSMRDVCLSTVADLQNAGLIPTSGADCTSYVPSFMSWETELYRVHARSADGTDVHMVLSANGAPCIDTTGGTCQQWSIKLRAP